MNFYMPTQVFQEKNAVKNNGAKIASFGKKALIVTGKSSSKKNHSLQDVIDVLNENATEYVIFDEVPQNPSVELIMKASEGYFERLFFGRRFIVPAFPVPLPFAVLPSGLAGVDYSVRCFPDSSVPGCCPSRCRFPYRFRYRCSGASPALPMPSGMSCALRTWLLLPGCDPACLPVLWVPGAGCPPLACLLSGGGRRLPWFFARAGRCVFRAGEPWDPG